MCVCVCVGLTLFCVAATSLLVLATHFLLLRQALFIVVAVYKDMKDTGSGIRLKGAPLSLFSFSSVFLSTSPGGATRSPSFSFFSFSSSSSSCSSTNHRRDGPLISTEISSAPNISVWKCPYGKKEREKKKREKKRQVTPLAWGVTR